MVGAPVENEKDETVHTTVCAKLLVFHEEGGVTYSTRMSCLTQQMSSRDDRTVGGRQGFSHLDGGDLWPRGFRCNFVQVDTARNTFILGSLGLKPPHR